MTRRSQTMTRLKMQTMDRSRDAFFRQLEDRHRDHTILVSAIRVLRTRATDPIEIAALLRAVAAELESES